MTKNDVLRRLIQYEGEYLSGEELARGLSLSRTAVWKAIAQLRAEGWPIESVTRRGYRLLPGGDLLSAEGVRAFLRHTELRLEVYRSVGSTNTLLKARAEQGEAAGLVLLASEQTAGRGRMGRSFYSPEGCGLYMSVLYRPDAPAADAVRITACAAVAVAETVEELSGRQAQIKWVNDVLVDGKKVCGILTEASLDCERGAVNYLIVGVGVNTAVPAGDYPEALRGVAGAAFADAAIPQLRCRLAAGILDRLTDFMADPGSEACFEAYRARSIVLGRRVNLLSPGREPAAAEALGLERDYALRVRLDDGTVRRISSGEVSLRLTE
ncbi:MAG: biotin--[acetyl-CoA-carboxylase] ligase [Oscillospiraceae bacterium]|nr:biotin--[acetyl-CoA-carboxylase] ligase [Oscillospiraceae bacterium]